MRTPQPREEKLPRWARVTLSSLRQEIVRLESVLREKEPAESNTFIAESILMREIGLGNSPTLRFKLSPRVQIDVRISEDQSAAGPFLSIASLYGTLSIVPQSYVIRVREGQY